MKFGAAMGSHQKLIAALGNKIFVGQVGPDEGASVTRRVRGDGNAPTTYTSVRRTSGSSSNLCPVAARPRIIAASTIQCTAANAATNTVGGVSFTASDGTVQSSDSVLPPTANDTVSSRGRIVISSADYAQQANALVATADDCAVGKDTFDIRERLVALARHPSLNLISVDLVQAHGAGDGSRRNQRARTCGDWLTWVHGNAIHAHLQKARAAIEEPRRKVQLNLEKSFIDRPAWPGHGRTDLDPVDGRSKQQKLQVSRAGKRLALLLQVTLVSDWLVEDWLGHDRARKHNGCEDDRSNPSNYFHAQFLVVHVSAGHTKPSFLYAVTLIKISLNLFDLNQTHHG
ncbi:MAG: hypothetical protein JJU31_14090 [Wenzhouxiangella sp.]|nr:hypothetical protein [Wenzhouxiangella sp.]